MIEKIPLNALKYFYFVAHYGSVTNASKSLHVTQSAVSKQVKNLENILGFELFDRVNKSLVLTDQGQKLYSSCQSAFTQLDNCLLDLQEPVTNNQLVLSCEPTISMRWLIPRLAKFKAYAQAKGHDFDVVLLTAGGEIDFAKTGADIALRRNDFTWGEHIYHQKIADEYMVTVTSSRHEATNRLLLTSSRPALYQQLSKLKKSGLLDKAILDYERMELEHFYLCIEGCLAGLGATLASVYMVEKELDYGLLKVINPPVPDSSAYYLLSAEPFAQDERKMIFMAWLRDEMTHKNQI